ncbi:BgTH12-01031 [Blumeria graminis f. sp. triticale]|uniref:BgTH12-01031 n=1 Tax=Blumeria graminis f. sp. triticale TaxID=1689686 RepID=A0A9W4DS32_BLUGR|nr:BgTH12-01031 [Blumeria graminis f. sp. triticale]
MASFQVYSFRPSSLTGDTHAPNQFEEDEVSILDESVFDPNSFEPGLDLSPLVSDTRRESLALSVAPMFSPKVENWQHLDTQPALSSNNPFIEHKLNNNSNGFHDIHGHENNPFMRLESHPSIFTHPGSWSLGNGSRMGTPMPVHGRDYFSSASDNDGGLMIPRLTASTFSPLEIQQTPLFPSGNGSESIPPSPQKEWSFPDVMDHHILPKRTRQFSPTTRSHSDFHRRGDGVRKKNARFDIPAERNLANIDQLIAQSTDEQEVKELKQQKRLLRNRQAALDSRQRKKQHTERLEDEKKHYTSLITDLEEDLAEAKHTINNLLRKQAQYQQFLENMQMEKEEMIRNHTIESGDLRKKVSVLTEHLQRMEVTGIPAQNSSSCLESNYADIDSLTTDGAWDNISFRNNFEAEPGLKSENLPISSKKVDSLINDTEKPAAQGLLLMLLLFGAFVASKGSSPSFPQMSDDVRAASASLLEDIFHDAGVAESTRSSSAVHNSQSSPPENSWQTAPVISVTSSESQSLTQSRIYNLADSLSQPTEEQKNEQLFSLSAAQYSGLTCQDFLKNKPQKSTSQGRRNLCETLATMRRNNQKETAAEVYTRSLLWDQVPSEVVRNFAKMVSDCNSQSIKNDCTPIDTA